MPFRLKIPQDLGADPRPGLCKAKGGSTGAEDYLTEPSQDTESGPALSNGPKAGKPAPGVESGDWTARRRSASAAP